MIRVAADISPQANVEAAASAAVHGVPVDQALGLRLIALARAATAQHMAQAASVASAPLTGSQASALVRALVREARP